MMRALILVFSLTALAGTGCSNDVDPDDLPGRPDASRLDAADLPGLDASDLPGPDASHGQDAGEPEPDAGPVVLPTVCPPSPRTYDRNFPAAMFCDASARITCDRYLNCCRLDPSMYDYCLVRQTAQCNQRDLVERIQGGAIELDMTTARACLDKEAARLSCTGDFLAPECSIKTLYKAMAGQGQACVLRYDCVSGRCARPLGQCGGKCQPFVGLAGVCNYDDLTCDPASTYCDFPSSKAYTGTCKSLIPTGGTCKFDSQCNPADDCAIPAGLSSGTCKAKIAAGAPCLRGDVCVDGYWCSGTCTKRESVAEFGSCAYSTDCQPGLYCKGYSPTGFGTCAQWKQPGSPCGSYLECRVDTNCIGGFCTPKRGENESCSSVYDCKWGMRCDAASGKCASLQPAGSTCAASDECKLYLNCLGNRCTASRFDEGQPCTNSSQCGANLWCPSATLVCTRMAALGAECPDVAESCPTFDCEHKRGTSTGICRPHCPL